MYAQVHCRGVLLLSQARVEIDLSQPSVPGTTVGVEGEDGEFWFGKFFGRIYLHSIYKRESKTQTPENLREKLEDE